MRLRERPEVGLAVTQRASSQPQIAVANAISIHRTENFMALTVPQHLL